MIIKNWRITMRYSQNLETHEVFNQSPIFGDINLYSSDKILCETVRREGGALAQDALIGFGKKMGSSETFDLGRQANEFLPILRTFDEKGYRQDFVEYHPAYHRIMALSFAQGLHCSPWECDEEGKVQSGGNVIRCAGLFMAAQVEGGHCCPITMTNAVVPVLRLQPDIGAPWLNKIMNREYDARFIPWYEKTSITIGMGMTEKQGGTDVRANTSKAEPAGDGAYFITGHKWFMSAPMCDGFLILAQSKGGLSCFLVPRHLPDGSLNAIHFQRLKNKLGNRSNASSEVEFHGAWGQMVGEEGRGVPAIIDMVTYTRLDCAISSAGLMRLVLANAIHHTSHRTVFQKKLIDQPMMSGVLADMALDVEAATLLAFRLARSFDKLADPQEAAWQRLMTPVSKYWICKIAPALAYEAMECFGGNGYVEDGLMARAYRDMPLNAIWEGSGNVMCLDVLRVMQKSPETLDIVLASFNDVASQDTRLQSGLNLLHEMLADRGRLETNGRAIVELLALLAAGSLLSQHAPSEISNAFLSTRLTGRWRHTYGASIEKMDTRAILARHSPIS
ncbi:MAG: acyl-CoA dehydrogenase family protein [Devosiaceae bacterium]|nr:acyl-CoA dehydrogenase family protein [Devosiaceae bacterium]